MPTLIVDMGPQAESEVRRGKVAHSKPNKDDAVSLLPAHPSAIGMVK